MILGIFGDCGTYLGVSRNLGKLGFSSGRSVV